MDSEGLTAEQVAERLTIHLGREVKPLTVNLRSGKARTPPEWAAVLGLDTTEEGHSSDETVEAASPHTTIDGVPSRAENDPPRNPGGATTVRPSGANTSDYGIVRDRLAKAYGAIGAGVSMVTQNDGYSAVATSYSGDLADAWIAAAKENENVAKIIAFLDSGGPVGELVIAHLILVGGFIYVSGKGPSLDFLYAGKFNGYRQLALAHGNTAAQAEPDLNGTAPAGATYSVGDSPV